MARTASVPALAAASALVLSACAMDAGRPAATTRATGSPLSFFITSVNPGQGANFGGLAGADRHCQSLATAVGAGQRSWRAYLSTTAAGGGTVVHARDRIGSGPWFNAKGVQVAANMAELHGSSNRLGKQVSLTEKGTVVNGRGDSPNMHDILTGSTPDGRASSAANDTTCRNWTSGDSGSAIVGHHDRDGTNPDPVANVSWNSSHGTQGCGLPQLARTGGAGLMYCFAAD